MAIIDAVIEHHDEAGATRIGCRLIALRNEALAHHRGILREFETALVARIACLDDEGLPLWCWHHLKPGNIGTERLVGARPEREESEGSRDSQDASSKRHGR